MSDWNQLNKYRVGTGCDAVPPCYWSYPEDGFNGMFRLFVLGQNVRCLASDGGGWQHVSVSIEGRNKPPYWEVMRSEEHTSELQSRQYLVCRLLLEKKN